MKEVVTIDSASEESFVEANEEEASVEESDDFDEDAAISAEEIALRRSSRLAQQAAQRCKNTATMACALHVSGIGEPLDIDEVMRRPNAGSWIAAMKDEIKSLIENETWELPPDRKPISSKWVF